MKRLAVFVSGGGTDFQSVIDGIKRGDIDAEIALCVASKPGIYAVERARENGIRCEIIQRSSYASADEMFGAVSVLLDSLRIDLIILAGYLTILAPSFVKRFAGKIINIHPSLIPKFCGDGFYGIKVHRAVIEAGETRSGATVHYVDEGVDTGRIIERREVPVFLDDTPETLAARVLAAEHELLPSVVAKLCADYDKK